MSDRSIFLILLAFVGIGILLGQAGFWLEQHESYESLPADDSCSLSVGPCSYELPEGGSFMLAVTPAGIPLMKPLDFNMVLLGVEATSIVIDIRGRNMDMGFNQVSMIHGPDDSWQGNGILPICNLRRMLWTAEVVLDSDQGRYKIPFYFETNR